MPGGDGTGPEGRGPMTGRGYESCGGGFHHGHRCGFLHHHFYRMPRTKAEEREAREGEIGIIEEELKAMREHLAELAP